MSGKRFVISDIHGCFQTFRYLLEKIIKPTEEDLVFLLGDYINKGPASKDILDYLIGLKEMKNVKLLRGNHEQVLLDVVDDKTSVFELYEKGGMHTMKSFGIAHPKDLDNEYLEFLRELSHYFELEDCWLVHAGFNLEISNPLQDVNAMLNIRQMPYQPSFLKNKKIIHGHIPVPLNKVVNYVKYNHWNIYLDSGCVYPKRPGMGFLSALELNSMSLTCKECIDPVTD